MLALVGPAAREILQVWRTGSMTDPFVDRTALTTIGGRTLRANDLAA
jgi:hypothetical protein